MRIAVFEDDKNVLEQIKKNAKTFDLDFFNCFEDFDPKIYDIVLLNKKFANKELIDKISGYKLEIGLLNKRKIEIDDDRISLILDIDEPKQFKEKLEYFEAKIRINDLMLKEQEKETETLSTLKLLSSGTSKISVDDVNTFEVRDGIGILEIRDSISFDENKIDSYLKSVDYRFCVNFLFSQIKSRHLGVLVNLWKKTKSFKGKIVYWNKQQDKKIRTLFELCKLNMLIDVVDRFDEVKIKIKGD